MPDLDKPTEMTEPEVDKKTVTPSSKKWLWPAAVIILVLVIIIGYAIINRQSSASDIAATESTAQSTSNPTSTDMTTTSATTPATPAPTTMTNNPDGQTFQSAKLKIGFYYADKSDGDPVSVKEDGDKVYISTAGPYSTSLTDGQSIEMFPKKSSDTLEMAIYEKFLADVSLDDCSVQVITKPEKSHPTWERAQIVAAGQEESGVPQESEKCPAKYQASNGISYFFMDPAFKDRFYFLSIGQYGINATNSGSAAWQDTLQLF